MQTELERLTRAELRASRRNDTRSRNYARRVAETIDAIREAHADAIDALACEGVRLPEAGAYQ